MPRPRSSSWAEDSGAYDYLLLAPGSRIALFDSSGVRENAVDLKGCGKLFRFATA
jgi:NADH dehydrogenase FAD-containing subunit